jgi:DNA-binding NarL/FixJ family response regulator
MREIFRQYLRQEGLTLRQIEVFGLVMQGLTNKEIGSRLYVTDKCIKLHTGNIFKKIPASNRHELLVWANNKIEDLTLNQRT